MDVVPPTVQVVAETTRRDVFVLDAIGAPVGEHPGQPIALLFARPDTAWFDAAIEHLLRRWADDGRVLKVQVRRGVRKDVAILEPDGGESSLRLDLMAVA